MLENSSDDCVHCYNIETVNLFEQELQLSVLKKFKVQIIVIVGHKKRNNYKIIHLIANLISSNSDSDEAFKSMHLKIGLDCLRPNVDLNLCFSGM